MVCTIQLEWIFLQHVTKGTGHTVEKLIRETFLSCLFFGKYKSLLYIIRTLSRMPVKKSGLGLQDPMTSSNDKYLSLLCAISDLIGDVTGESGSSTTYNLQAVKEERCDGKKIGLMSTTPNSRESSIIPPPLSVASLYTQNTWVPV